MTKYKYNVNKNCIEKNSKFVAYVNVIDAKQIVDLLNEQEDKLKRIEKEVYTCNIYHDNLKDIILKIRCILDGDIK